MQGRPIAFKYSAGGAARSMPAYDDGTTPTLVTEKPPAVVTQYGSEVAGTLTARHDSSPCTDRGQNMVAIAVRTANTGANGSGVTEELAHTVDTTGPESVVLKVRGGADTYMKHDGKVGTAGKGALASEEVTFTVAATQDQTLFQPHEDSYVVRRLTPTECERLQGFPDGWTDIGEWTDSKGKKRQTTDGNRYKALGNSFAVPVVRWLGERLQAVENLGT